MLKKFSAALLTLAALTACSAAEEPPISNPGDNEVYFESPDLASCTAGVLQDAHKEEALQTLNEIRALHGLPAAAYNLAADDEVAEAALIMLANNSLDHNPPSTARCFSSAGLRGAQTSNLYIHSASETLDMPAAQPVEAFLGDVGVASLGHRRWLLDPFLGSTAFGRADGKPAGSSNQVMTAALKVISNDSSPGASAPDFIAYPQGDYPARLVNKNWFLSFSVLNDKEVKANNGADNIDFSFSSIEVLDVDLQPLAVSEASYNYEGYGLPNVLQWKVAGLQNGQSYQVTINNVRVDGILRRYRYNFRLVP